MGLALVGGEDGSRGKNDTTNVILPSRSIFTYTYATREYVALLYVCFSSLGERCWPLASWRVGRRGV
jgi:hypothetical protein